MNNNTTNSIHWNFWVVSVATLIWNIMGGINFFMQMDASASAVFGGVLGCLLLFRKSAASYVFVLSLLGVIVTMVHAVGVMRSQP